MPEPLIICHFSTSNMSVGNLSIFGEFLSHCYPKYLSAVAMATGMCRDERSVDCLVLFLGVHVISFSWRILGRCA